FGTLPRPHSLTPLSLHAALPAPTTWDITSPSPRRAGRPPPKPAYPNDPIPCGIPAPSVKVTKLASSKGVMGTQSRVGGLVNGPPVRVERWSMTHDEATVAASDIARLAHVGRAAVSNWRRRYDDFPQPVGGTASSPLFRLVEVEAWLARHGKAFRVTPEERLWQRLRATVDDLRLGDAV